METDREAVLKIHPDAYLNEDYSGAPSADVAVFRKATKEDWPNNREVQIGNFCGSNEAAWKSAHSRLLVNTPAPHPDLPHQADGDDFPEPHMGVQPEPEESPELAQTVAPGERKQGHSALRLDSARTDDGWSRDNRGFSKRAETAYKMGREIMMILRWLWFCLGLLGWVLIVLTIWHKMGWIFGVFLTLLALLNIAEWTERMLLKQWKMRKITSYEDD